MDPEKGKCAWTDKKLDVLVKKLREYFAKLAEGTFFPDRENDELTEALGNPEQPGRTRGTQAPFCGSMDFPTQAVTKAGKGRGKRSSA